MPIEILNPLIRYFKYLSISKPNPKKWLFIAGCPNSGTTLLHDVLALHPSIGSLPHEGQFCSNELITPVSLGVSRIWITKLNEFYLDENSKVHIHINRLKKDWGSCFNDASRPVLMEKSPTNAVRLRWLQEKFQNAYFIGIHRNGYAVTKGISLKTGASIDIAALQWYKSNEIMRQDFTRLRNGLMISYEELSTHPAETIRQITDWLGLCPLSADLIAKEFVVQGKQGKISNLNAQSIDQLSRAEINRISEIAEPLLSSLNYYKPEK